MGKARAGATTQPLPLAFFSRHRPRRAAPPAQEKLEHEEERLSLYRDRERLNKELNRLTNERGGGSGSGSPLATATAVQVRPVTCRPRVLASTAGP